MAVMLLLMSEVVNLVVMFLVMLVDLVEMLILVVVN